MKKPKKTEALERKVRPLDLIADQLRTILQRGTKDVIEIGNLLIESRGQLEHGEWQRWLAENFDLTYRTALRYCTAAEYLHACRGKSDTMSLINVSPTVLYALAEGRYSEEAEKAILAASHKGRRIDQTRAEEIREEADSNYEGDAAEDESEAEAEAEAEDDADPEIAAILDGPQPDVPPPAPIAPPPDFAVQSFNEAVDALKKLVTKPAAQFVTTTPVDDLMKVIAFLQAVLERASANQTKQRDKQ
jgi:hypothetical protein